MTTTTRVLIADDSQDITEVYCALINQEPGLECVGTADSATGLCESVRALRPDIVVVDLTMPGRPPLEAIREISSAIPTCRVIAFSGYDDPDTTDSAIDAGAWACVSKNGDPLALIHAIRSMAAG